LLTAAFAIYIMYDNRRHERQEKETLRGRSVMPALVVEAINSTSCKIMNVGTGPALNGQIVVVVEGRDLAPKRLQAIARDTLHVETWSHVDIPDAVVLRYSNLFGTHSYETFYNFEEHTNTIKELSRGEY